MKPWLLLAALPFLGGCVSLADYGEDPYAQHHRQSAYPGQSYPGWWGQDAVSVNIFLGSSLGRYGNWDRHPSFGQVWYPRGLSAGWQPYTRGYWANDPRYGRRWVSYDPFGFATDHYGRWNQDPARGWYWVPGTRFQPGWSQPPQGWRPPAANQAGWRPPAANSPGWRPPAARPNRPPPVAEGPGTQRPDRPGRNPEWRQRPGREGEAMRQRPGREGEAMRQRPSPDIDGIRDNPARAERPANRQPRAERPQATTPAAAVQRPTAQPRAERQPRPAPPASSARTSSRDATGGPIRED